MSNGAGEAGVLHRKGSESQVLAGRHGTPSGSGKSQEGPVCMAQCLHASSRERVRLTWIRT